MELKNAVAVCLISMFSATLVLLIARALEGMSLVQESQPLVESLPVWHAVRIGLGQPPLAGDARRISGRFENFGHRGFVRIQPVRRNRPQHRSVGVRVVEAHTARIASGQQAGPRGVAGRRRAVRIGEQHAGGGHRS